MPRIDSYTVQSLAATYKRRMVGRLAEQYNVSALLFLVSIALGAITLGLFILAVMPFVEQASKAVFKRIDMHERKGPP